MFPSHVTTLITCHAAQALLQAAAALLPLLRDEGLVLCGPSAARLVDALLTLVSSLRAGEAQGAPRCAVGRAPAAAPPAVPDDTTACLQAGPTRRGWGRP